MKELNIQMRQVNCVENGDLCEREDISFYPNMKLYSPVKDAQTKEIIPGKHKNVGTFPRALPRTVENFKKYLKNAVAEYDEGSIDLPSSSVLLNQQDLFKLAAGEGEEPVFVSFYAASDENYQNSEEKTKDDFPMGCFDCKHISQVWAKLSNQVLSTVKTGHMNCLTNKLACKQLGLDKLIEENSRANIAPRFIMFLPGVTGLTRIEYDQEIELQAMKKWTNRLMENYLFETINARTLPEVLDVKKSLPFEPLNSYYPLSNKMLLIFYHKDIELSQEDRAMLSYILLYVTNLPFNINIYLSSDEKILEYIQAQAKNMVEFINYDDSSTEPVHTFLAPRFVTTTLTHIPTLMMFKENTLITPIYQNFAIEDMRNNLKVKEFIDRNQFPLYQELTPSLLDVYFPSKFPSPRNKDSVITKTDKVVVAFIDSNDASLTNSQLFNLSLIAHEYSHIKKEYYFESLLSKRDDKRVLVDHLVRQDKDSLEIVAAMRQEIPHYFQNDEVLFTFIDVSTNADLAKDLGWDVTGEKYQVGDAIIVSRNDKFYWNKDITGTEILKIDPYKLKPVLQYLLNPKLVTETHKNVYVSSILIGSPFSNSLRYLDLVHSHGFLGYIYLWAALYAAYYIFRKLRRRRGGGHPRLPKSHTGLGILGKKD